VDFEAVKAQLQEEFGSKTISELDVMSHVMYPKVFEDYAHFREKYGPVTNLPTRLFFVGPELGEDFEVELDVGKTLNVKILAIGDIVSDGKREVFCEINGVLRPILVEDTKVIESIVRNAKANKGDKGSIGAPMPGKVIAVGVDEGQTVEKGDIVVVLSAMKMETNVTAPFAGRIKSVAATQDMQVQGDDLLVEIEPL
jgi:pyruvate carboxylase